MDNIGVDDWYQTELKLVQVNGKNVSIYYNEGLSGYKYTGNFQNGDFNGKGEERCEQTNIIYIG